MITANASGGWRSALWVQPYDPYSLPAYPQLYLTPFVFEPEGVCGRGGAEGLLYTQNNLSIILIEITK